MTALQLAAMIRLKTHTNATTFTDADMLTLVNTFKDEISSMIVERNAGYFLIDSLIDLVASGTTRKYSFPADLLNRIQKVEIKFATGDSRFPAQNIKDYHGSETESEIVKNYSNAPGQFAYTIRSRQLFLLSGTTIAVTDGIKLWSHEYPVTLANLTDTTDLSIDPSSTSFGFPRQFHELLARRVAIEYKDNQPKPIRLGRKEQQYEQDLGIQLAAISTTDNSAEIIAQLPSSEELGNDGWDY